MHKVQGPHSFSAPGRPWVILKSQIAEFQKNADNHPTRGLVEHVAVRAVMTTGAVIAVVAGGERRPHRLTPLKFLPSPSPTKDSGSAPSIVSCRTVHRERPTSCRSARRRGRGGAHHCPLQEGNQGTMGTKAHHVPLRHPSTAHHEQRAPTDAHGSGDVVKGHEVS